MEKLILLTGQRGSSAWSICVMCMETGGTGYRLHQSMSWNHILNKPVLRCIEIVLSCLEADRSKKLSIGDIVDKLNETMFPFGGNDPGSLISLLEKLMSVSWRPGRVQLARSRGESPLDNSKT